MKPFAGCMAVVCLAALIAAAAPNLQAQVGVTGLTGTDPGVQSVSTQVVNANAVTCSSSNNPNHVADAAASNPHSLATINIPLPLQGITQNQLDLFCAAVGRFQEVDSVAGVATGTTGTNCTPADLPPGSSGTILCLETGSGLGPRFNGNSCAMCHGNPVILGASSTINPELGPDPALGIPSGGVGVMDGATNTLTPFVNAGLITQTTAIKEVRFINTPITGGTDGNVHDLFTITNRVDATGAININPGFGDTSCQISQPDFADAITASNVVFRIPIIIQGDGLVELIDDKNLENNSLAEAGSNGVVADLFNRSGNDFTITRFGWKAQNKSTSIFAGEAYNVEQGVTNDLFPNERRIDDDLLGEQYNPTIQNCQFVAQPDDTLNIPPKNPSSLPGILASQFSTDVLNFAAASRLSAPPPRNAGNFSTSDVASGQSLFTSIGCAQCHSTNASKDMVTSGTTSFPVNQGNQAVLAFSDFAIHTMAGGFNYSNPEGLPLGCLDDGVTQGSATGNMFRTAPLWGTASRIFFLHDGRTSNLGDAILYHDCSGSEAHYAVQKFIGLSPGQQNQLLEYLRTL